MRFFSATSRVGCRALLIFTICWISPDNLAHAQSTVSAPPPSLVAEPKRSSVEVLGQIPHDRDAFTEGLTFWNGRLFESSGLYGHSFLHEIDPISGKELRRIKLEDRYFGEGLAALKGKLYQLTWREHVCFVYDIATLRKSGEIKYDGEGWGLTTDGTALIMSDGSEWIRFRDPATLRIQRAIRVLYRGNPVANLNELEYIDGAIWANVWGSNFILRIDPRDGRIIEIVDASGVLSPAQQSGDRDDVLNGIAYDARTHNLLITGKRWPEMFRIRPSR